MSNKYDLNRSDPEYPYLTVDRENLPPDVTPFHEGKRSCWVPHSTDGYVAAEALPSKDAQNDDDIAGDDVISVRTERGDVWSSLIIILMEAFFHIHNLYFVFIVELFVLYFILILCLHILLLYGATR